MMEKERLAEGALLLAVFGILLWMGLGAYYDHQLNPSFPKGFMATDSFYKYDRAASLDETGNNRYVPSYLTGGINGLEEVYPFVSFHNIVLFNDASGLELYNSQYLLNVLYVILAGLLMYTLLKRYNPKIALLSLGLYGFLFIGNFNIGFLYGWWPQIMGSLLLMGMMWTAVFLEQPGFPFLFAVMAAAAFLTHPPEGMMGGAFAAVIILVDWVKNRFSFHVIKRSLWAFLLFVILIAYYLPIVISDDLLNSTGSFSFSSKASTFPAPMVSHFSWYWWLVLAGVLVAVVILINKKGKNWKFFWPAFFMGAITYSAIIGINERVYQNRFFWPIYLSIFFGLSLYAAIKYLPTKIARFLWCSIPAVLLLISLVYYFQPPAGTGLIANEEMWEGIRWVRENVPAENKVLIFYGDSYNQNGIYSAFGHIVYHTDWNYYLNNIGYNLSESLSKIQKGEVTENYTSRPFIHQQRLPKRVSLFKLEYVDIWKELGLNYEKVDGKGRGFEPRSICDFDYVVFDKKSQIPEFAEYNLKVRGELLKNNFVTEAFSNSWYSILKNEKLGEKCIKNGK